MKVEQVALGKILTQQLDRTPVDPTGLYPIAGVLGFGRGLLLREAIRGTETQYSFLSQIREGQVVYSKVKAFEGAFTVVNTAGDRRFVSPEFPVFDINESVDAAYLRHFLASERFMAQVRALSSGIGARRERVSPTKFLSIKIALPPASDQRRIAAHLDSVEQGGMQVPTSRGREARAMLERAISMQLEALDNWAPLGELCEINPRPRTLAPEDEINFVPMSAVSDVSGTVVSPERRTRGQLQSGYKQALPGDIIFARITPCMQNGKCAVYRPAEQLPMYGSTEFHVLRCDSELVDWIHTVLRSHWFIDLAEASFTGTAGQQRVPVEFLRRVRVPVPDNPEVATARMRTLSATVQAIAHHDAHSQELSRSLLPAARNEVFNALQ